MDADPTEGDRSWDGFVDLLQQLRAELEENRREREELRAVIAGLTAPKKRKSEAHWRPKIPEIMEIVRTKGFAVFRDVADMGLCGEDWQRSIGEIKKREPSWKVTPIKHANYLHLPDFDLSSVVDSGSIYDRPATDPELLQHLVEEVKKAGRLSMVNYLQAEVPKIKDLWMRAVINALGDFVENNPDHGVEHAAHIFWTAGHSQGEKPWGKSKRA
ncbi:hypothetical protein [Methanomassiliicoccus luminyensis]|uniref:hypothetical protein n=1 Tax=Methanomassiliicoccus luminyensis TaxID=1080712 RepID=UPI00036650EB|nr:hypothetical protein [Methanomassiliicoccus luminyensis]